VDRRFGLGEFVDSEIGKRGASSSRSSEAWSREGSWPMVVVHGHIKGKSSIES
jgi:hypothetical protein